MLSDAKYKKLMLRIAQNIRRAREARGLTQEGMTSHGFSYRHYQRVESGTYSINLYTLFRIAQALRVDIADLLT